MTRCCLWSLLTLLLLSTTATPASAQSATSKQELINSDFDTLLGLAKEAFEDENFDAAIEALLLANRQEPDPRLLLNIARSFERADDCRSALGYYAAFLRHHDAEPSLAEMAQQELEEGRESCPEFDESLSGRLMIESHPLLASVYLNEQFIGLTPTEIIALPKGDHTFRFELEGYEDTVEHIQLQSSKDRTLGVTLATPKTDDEENIALTPPPQPEDTDKPAFNPIAIGLAGGGLALVTTGLILDVAVVPTFDKKREALDRDSQEFADLTKQRLAYRNAFLGSYIAGGLLLASGAAWIIYDFIATSSDDPSKDAANYVLAPGLGESGASLNFVGRF